MDHLSDELLTEKDASDGLLAGNPSSDSFLTENNTSGRILPENPSGSSSPENNASGASLPKDNSFAEIPPVRDASDRFLTEDDASEEFLPEDKDTPDDADTDNSLVLYDSLYSVGVNVQLGLDYCCGEEEFYLEMLRMFCSQAVDKKAEIISLYDAGNWEDYAIKVHALKSTSLTIGAERLADQAKLLEQAGKKRNIEYIRHGHPALLRLYDELCEILAVL